MQVAGRVHFAESQKTQLDLYGTLEDLYICSTYSIQRGGLFALWKRAAALRAAASHRAIFLGEADGKVVAKSQRADLVDYPNLWREKATRK